MHTFVRAYSNEIMQINQEYPEHLISNKHMHFLCLPTCPYPALSYMKKLEKKSRGLSLVPIYYCNKKLKFNKIIINKQHFCYHQSHTFSLTISFLCLAIGTEPVV